MQNNGQVKFPPDLINNLISGLNVLKWLFANSRNNPSIIIAADEFIIYEVSTYIPEY